MARSVISTRISTDLTVSDQKSPPSEKKRLTGQIDVWTHGDIIMVHPVTRHILFLGRADGVLNPSGIRFGSAEIYNVIESRFSRDVVDSLCVGQRRPEDQDETVILFLLMKPGVPFTRGLVADIKAEIRKELSPRHVPKYIFETPEIPVRDSEQQLSGITANGNLDHCQYEKGRDHSEAYSVGQEGKTIWHTA